MTEQNEIELLQSILDGWGYTETITSKGTSNIFVGQKGEITDINLQNIVHPLKGPIPSTIGSFPMLIQLILCKNNLTGPLPSEIGNLSNLTNLNFADNNLTGALPSEIGNLNNLTFLEMSGNNLTGPIPSEIGNLTNLNMLDLSTNKITGSLPSEIGNLTKLTVLGLSQNNLTGEIPSEIGKLSNLNNLVLSENKLTGEIPSEITNLNGIQILYLRNNCLNLTSDTATYLKELKNTKGNDIQIDNNCFSNYPGLETELNCTNCNGCPNKTPCGMINIYDNCLDKGGCKGTSYGKTVYFESKGEWEGQIQGQLQANCIPEGGLHLSTKALADKNHYYGFLHYFDSENCNNRCKGTVDPNFTGVDKKWVIQFRDKGDYIIRNIEQNPSSNPKAYQLKICESNDSCKIIELPINLPSTSKGDPSVVYKGNTNIETYIYIQYVKAECSYKASTCNSSLCPPPLNLGDSLEESPTETKKKPKYRMCYNSRTGCFQIVH